MHCKQQLLYFSLIICAFLLSNCSSKEPFTKNDVRHAQKLMGIEFSNSSIDTMYNYLLRNHAGYDSMQAYTLENEVFPALIFNPIPDSFEFPLETYPYKFYSDNNVEMPENREELAFYTVAQLSQLIRSRQISSEELVNIYLDRIKKFDPTLKAFITITDDQAIQQAKKADREINDGHFKGPLHGIPYGLKDLVAVKGFKTTWGAYPYKDQEFNYSATIVEKLEDAGAVLLGKLSSGSLARGDVWFGGQTVNPWDTLQGASGSSAGSGASTAAGLVGFSIGTETLGSITSPSERNGVTGLRPSYGQVSRYGVMTLSWSMDKVGPICRSAEDCAIVFDVIRGQGGKDQTLYNVPFNYDSFTALNKYKVGYLKEDIEKDTTEVHENILSALEIIRKFGINLQDVSLPEELPFSAFDIILRAESGAFFDELIRSSLIDSMVQQSQRSRANSLRQSRFIPAAEYIRANRYRTLLIDKVHRIMKDLDVLIAPTSGSRQLLITNLTGHPAITLPTGLDKKGRPTSITLIGNLFEEGKILRLAIEYQKVTDHEEARPPLFDVEN